jgi:hypothetical protein
LEREKVVSDRLIEDLAWNVEQLNFRHSGLLSLHGLEKRVEKVEQCLHQFKQPETAASEQSTGAQAALKFIDHEREWSLVD